MRYFFGYHFRLGFLYGLTGMKKWPARFILTVTDSLKLHLRDDATTMGGNKKWKDMDFPIR